MCIWLATQCQSYEGGLHEKMKYVVFTAPAAKTIWGYFARYAGVRWDGLQLYLMIKEWWFRGETKDTKNL